MGVLTNGASERQRAKLANLGVSAYFPEERILASQDVGVIKPELAIFRAYEEKTGFTPERLWMIGDNYETDITGALAAGWHALWLNRKKEKIPAGGALPDYEAETEEEICDYVMSMGTVLADTKVVTSERDKPWHDPENKNCQ